LSLYIKADLRKALPVLGGVTLFYARFDVALLAIHAKITGRALRRLGYYLMRDFFSIYYKAYIYKRRGGIVARGALLYLGFLLLFIW
jgi:hypothetical protein